MNSANREKEVFSKLIKELRSNRDLNQRQFADLFSPRVTYQAIGQWERGKAIPARKYWKTLAQLAEMDLGQFYEYVGIGSTSTSSLLEDTILKIKSLTPAELKEVLQVTIQQSSFLGVSSSGYNPHHLAMLKKGAKSWNKWRSRNPEVIPQLSGINLFNEDCRDLNGYNLDYANLDDVCGQAISLRNASLNKASLKNVEFKESDFSKASFVEANLENARLSYANFYDASMYMVNLSGVQGVRVCLERAFLKKANLNGIDLANSTLNDANLNGASLERANLNNCCIFGVSLWGVKTNEIKMNDVYISRETQKSLELSNLELVQTIYYLFEKQNASFTE